MRWTLTSVKAVSIAYLAVWGSVTVIFHEVKGALPLVRLTELYPLATNQSICFRNMAEPFSYSDRRADMGDKISMSGL